MKVNIFKFLSKIAPASKTWSQKVQSYEFQKNTGDVDVFFYKSTGE